MQQEDKSSIFQMRFPQKLWYMLNMQTDAILWGGTGRTILLNYRILHTYLQSQHSIFKTTNISSFVRQLNLYGFRKVTSHLQDPLCNSCNPYMHEYVHDYFEHGRPELLNKITRKALTFKKNDKTKDVYYNSDQMLYLSPLEKARRNLREALKRAANNFYIHSSRDSFSLNYDSEDPCPENSFHCNTEELTQFDWVLNKEISLSIEKDSLADTKTKSKHDIIKHTELSCFNEVLRHDQEDNHMSHKDANDHQMYYNDINDHSMSYKESNEQINDSFPTQFLSMPDLDPEPIQDTGVELLAEFNIGHDPDTSIVKELNVTKENGHGSLNCVLPAIACDCDPIDDVTMREGNNLDQYNTEWDQMFKDIMVSKVSAQECGSELKELYSQISRTINLLND